MGVEPEPPIGGRYHVDIEQTTWWGHGSYGEDRVIWLDAGPCQEPDCEKEHVWISQREILTFSA